MDLPVTPLEGIAIGLEYVRPILAALVVIAVIDLVLLALTALGVGSRFQNVGRALSATLTVGVVVGVISLLLVLPSSGASVDDLNGFVDYFTLLFVAIGLGGAAALVCYPPVQFIVGTASQQPARMRRR